MPNIQTLVVGEMETNCYLVSDSDECLIIDPGDDADFITQTILESKLKPVAIVLTHGHFDHALGCLELKLNFQIPVMLHKNDLKLYSSANQSALHWLKKRTLKVPPIDQYIKEGDEIKLGNEKLRVIESPGHTPGSICLMAASCQPPAVFTGDTLFANGVGRTDFSYSSPSDLQTSLAKLKAVCCQLSAVIYPGHGDLFPLKNFVG